MTLGAVDLVSKVFEESCLEQKVGVGNSEVEDVLCCIVLVDAKSIETDNLYFICPISRRMILPCSGSRKFVLSSAAVT